MTLSLDPPAAITSASIGSVSMVSRPSTAGSFSNSTCFEGGSASGQTSTSAVSASLATASGWILRVTKTRGLLVMFLLQCGRHQLLNAVDHPGWIGQVTLH